MLRYYFKIDIPVVAIKNYLKIQILEQSILRETNVCCRQCRIGHIAKSFLNSISSSRNLETVRFRVLLLYDIRTRRFYCVKMLFKYIVSEHSTTFSKTLTCERFISWVTQIR